MKNIRNTNIELFRLALIVGICFWHIIIHGYDLKSIGEGQGTYPSFWAILCSFLSPATYCFMFISGYYGIKYTKSKAYNLFYMAFFCFVTGLIIKCVFFDSFSLGYLIRHIFPISTGTWWFLTGYMMVFLLSPLISRGIETIEKKQFNQIIFLMTMLEVFSFIKLIPNSGSNFYGLLYIYILAQYIRKYDLSWGKKLNICIYGGCMISLSVLLLILINMPINFNKYTFIFLGYNNPLIIGQAITLFFIVKGLTPFYSPLINKLCSPILYVYLLTEIIGLPLYKFEANLIDYNCFVGLVFFIGVVFVALIIGYIGNSMYKIFTKSANIASGR